MNDQKPDTDDLEPMDVMGRLYTHFTCPKCGTEHQLDWVLSNDRYTCENCGTELFVY